MENAIGVLGGERRILFDALKRRGVGALALNWSYEIMGFVVGLLGC